MSPPSIHQNSDYTWIGKLHLYTDKVTGRARDRQKQPGPWNRELMCLIVRTPVSIAVIAVDPAGKYSFV